MPDKPAPEVRMIVDLGTIRKNYVAKAWEDGHIDPEERAAIRVIDNLTMFTEEVQSRRAVAAAIIKGGGNRIVLEQTRGTDGREDRQPRRRTREPQDRGVPAATAGTRITTNRRPNAPDSGSQQGFTPMPDTEFSTKNTVTRFVWAEPKAYEKALWSHPALIRARAGKGVESVDAAMVYDKQHDDTAFHRYGDRLYRVTVEEVEVPEPSWWHARDDGDGCIRTYRVNRGDYAPATVVIRDGGVISKTATVQATNEASAVTAAKDAWRELAAKIGGEL